MKTSTVSTTNPVDLDVFARYAGLSLPRHVSYPMPTWWHDIDTDEAIRMHADSRCKEPRNDLSLYLHIPFCETLCKFCACTRVIQRKEADGAADRTRTYVAALVREIAELAGWAGSDRPLRQIHWGGGSPLYLDAAAIERIHRTITDSFTLAPGAEVSMEIDPRNASRGTLEMLWNLGFNRLSMGVQDYDKQVQKHVRRIQPFELVRQVVTDCRDVGFPSVNFDLIYGLPYQSIDTIRDTVERTISLSPDRVAFYHYAQIPEKIATQRGMDYTKLPDSETKLEMFLLGCELFQNAGYDFVGLDHFAQSDELLARAAREGTLQRNFQGMTTGGGLDLIGAGASSISHLAGIGFLQNVRDVAEYVERMSTGRSAIHRGKRFSFDDKVRQAVIAQLYCSGEIQPRAIEEEFEIVFADYFQRELGIMADLAGDGLVAVDPDGTIRATMPLGRVLLRTVAAVFDGYLEPDAYRVGDQNCFSANA